MSGLAVCNIIPEEDVGYHQVLSSEESERICLEPQDVAVALVLHTKHLFSIPGVLPSSDSRIGSDGRPSMGISGWASFRVFRKTLCA